MSRALHILSPGPYSMIQDLGRFGVSHLGVPTSGVLDDYAGRIANWLVGNPASYASLEMTLIGARIEILSELDIAITGAAMQPQLNGRPCRQWTTIRVHPGDILSLGPADSGCRAYLAITGGIKVPPVLGSRSTYLGGRLGGLKGRILAAGDILHCGKGQLLKKAKTLPWFPLYPESVSLRAIAGPHNDHFRDNLQQFFSASFTMTAQSDRMGVRLAGPVIQRDRTAAESILSEPISPGNVQIPAGGQPIVLLKEQTIGGYTVIATVISIDIWRIGQSKPGDRVCFVEVTLQEAHRLYREWTEFFKDIEEMLARQ